MKFGYFFSVFASSFFLVASSVPAEFRCESEVRYRWKPTVKAVPLKPGTAGEQAAPEKPSGSEEKKDGAGNQDGREVFWSLSSSTGELEDQAKASLKTIITEQRAKADMACRDAHENQTKCVATKYLQNATTFQMMGFTQRKAFEKKIIEDCEQASGNCLGSAATEPVCQEVKKAEAAPAADAKGKDAKKK